MNDKPEAVAWMYTRLGETHVSSEQWALPEADYVETPLYAHPPSQPDATALVEALRPFAKFVDKETCTITMIWEDGDYRSHYTNVLKPVDFFNAREALSAWEQSNAGL